jgi:hypothetical protein
MKNFLFKYPLVAKILLAWLCVFGLAHAAEDPKQPDLPRMADEFFDRWKQPYLINYFRIADRSNRRYTRNIDQQLIPITFVQRNFLGGPSIGPRTFENYDQIIFRRHDSTYRTLLPPTYPTGSTNWNDPRAGLTQGHYTAFLASSLIWDVPNSPQPVLEINARAPDGTANAPGAIPNIHASFHLPGQDYSSLVNAQLFPEEHHTLICDGTEQEITVRSGGNDVFRDKTAGYGIRIRYQCRRLDRYEVDDFFIFGLRNTVITARDTTIEQVQARIRATTGVSAPIIIAASRPPQPHAWDDDTTYSMNSRHRPPSRCIGSPYAPHSTSIGVPVAGTPALNTTGNQNEQSVYGPGGTCNLKNDINRKLLANACDQGSEGVTSLCLHILFPACQLQKVPTTDSRSQPCGKP